MIAYSCWALGGMWLTKSCTRALLEGATFGS